MRVPPPDAVYPVALAGPGSIVLPHFLVRRLALAPGEIFALVAGPLSLRLDRYAELLVQVQGMAHVDAWTEVERFLRAPLAGLGPDGSLRIPPEVPAYGQADSGRAWLQVVWRGPAPELYLFREGDEEDSRGAVA
jgi:hypothetical protein